MVRQDGREKISLGVDNREPLDHEVNKSLIELAQGWWHYERMGLACLCEFTQLLWMR